jgi:hypothetical protein
MSDQPEPLSAILAEMRDYADHRAADAGGERPAVELLRSYAARIEAAAMRERNAHTNDIHDALYLATGIPGNAAAMRVALTAFVGYLTQRRIDEVWAKTTLPEPGLDRLVAQARAALAAPARRNCDRFATELDARLAWKRETKCKGDYRYWLFAPAEGGDHA